MLLEKQRSVCGNTNGDSFALKANSKHYFKFSLKCLKVGRNVVNLLGELNKESSLFS